MGREIIPDEILKCAEVLRPKDSPTGQRKGMEMIEAAMPDHIHLYMAIPIKYSISEVMGALKGKSRSQRGQPANPLRLAARSLALRVLDFEPRMSPAACAGGVSLQGKHILQEIGSSGSDRDLAGNDTDVDPEHDVW